jgi:hypothetical protein
MGLSCLHISLLDKPKGPDWDPWAIAIARLRAASSHLPVGAASESDGEKAA